MTAGNQSQAVPPRDASSQQPRPSIEIVVALAANGVIGKNGGLPWNLPADLKHFKNLTMGRPIIMGRRTFEEVGKPLPGRRSIVVSTTWASPPAGVELARSLDDAITLAASSPGPVFVIGGAVLFEAALPRTDVLHLTEIDDPVDGDTVFPTFDRAQWSVVSEARHERDERHAHAFWIRRYERATGGGHRRG